MKQRIQECRQVLIKLLRRSNLFLLVFFVLVAVNSCSHSKDQICKECALSQNRIKQTLKLKIYHPKGTNRLTIYSKIDRENETAILEGIGPLGRHVFTLNIKVDAYEFTDRLNNKTMTGKISDFSVIPLDRELLFKKIDISEPQPIVIDDAARGVKVEVTVKEQEPWGEEE